MKKKIVLNKKKNLKFGLILGLFFCQAFLGYAAFAASWDRKALEKLHEFTVDSVLRCTQDIKNHSGLYHPEETPYRDEGMRDGRRLIAVVLDELVQIERFNDFSGP